MLILDQEPAFILKRFPYGENRYLIDLLTKNHGLIRAVARISQQKTHRDTEQFAPFRELLIHLSKKTDLGNLHSAETKTIFPLQGKNWLTANYLNEIILQNQQLDTDALLYEKYKLALSSCDARHIRELEVHLLSEAGLLPERDCDADFYTVDYSAGWGRLVPSKNGFSAKLINAVEADDLSALSDLEINQLKNYLQPLFQSTRSQAVKTKRTAITLLNLLKN